MRSFVLATMLMLPAVAVADGAFPDSLQLVAPEAGERLYLSTTFGFITSADDGATWSWTCEEAIGPNVAQYQVGAGAQPLLYAVDADQRLHVSRDDGRSWMDVESPLFSGGFVYDPFPDPIDPRHVVALNLYPGPDGTSPARIVESSDGAGVFRVLYDAPPGTRLESVEISRSEASVTWAVHSTYDATGWGSTLVRLESGREVSATSLEPFIGRALARIAAVDPVEPGKLYLRATLPWPGRDSLVVVRNSGAAVSVPLRLEAAMSSFLRRTSGELIVATAEAGVFISRDAGRSFTKWEGAPAIRALAERSGVLYAAADPARDGFAVGRSFDGTHWEPLLVWSGLCGILPSDVLAERCGEPWRVLVERFQIEGAPACREPPAVSTDDHGAGATRGCGCDGAGTCAALVGLVMGRARRRVRPRSQP